MLTRGHQDVTISARDGIMTTEEARAFLIYADADMLEEPCRPRAPRSRRRCRAAPSAPTVDAGTVVPAANFAVITN